MACFQAVRESRAQVSPSRAQRAGGGEAGGEGPCGGARPRAHLQAGALHAHAVAVGVAGVHLVVGAVVVISDGPGGCRAAPALEVAVHRKVGVERVSWHESQGADAHIRIVLLQQRAADCGGRNAFSSGSCRRGIQHGRKAPAPAQGGRRRWHTQSGRTRGGPQAITPSHLCSWHGRGW